MLKIAIRRLRVTYIFLRTGVMEINKLAIEYSDFILVKFLL